MITILDYGVGNIKAIHNMLRKIGVESRISSSAGDLTSTDKLILPGVGAFDHGISSLQKSGLLDTLYEEVLVKKKPILGICLGMQLMTKGSEEGKLSGLGWIDAVTRKFQLGNNFLSIPHMGWNELVNIAPNSRLFQDLSKNPRFYFVHSYFVTCHNESDIEAQVNYGEPFTCSFQHENIYGVQFHPEKSHKYGMKLLANFAAI